MIEDAEYILFNCDKYRHERSLCLHSNETRSIVNIHKLDDPVLANDLNCSVGLI